MRSAHRQELIRLLLKAFDEAEALGFTWVGPEDFTLAILASDDSAARSALEHFGITHDSFAAAYASSIAGSFPPVHDPEDDRSSGTNPAAHELMGRAEGIAIGFGAPVVTREHVLIAYLWDDHGTLKAFFDVKREAVLKQLRVLGAQVPDGSLPPPPPPKGRPIFIPYDESDAIIGKLLERLPAGSGFGCNHDEKSLAWVLADAKIDLAAYVAEVLDDLGLEPVPQPERP